MGETIIKIEHVSKEYRLGAIGGGTLRGDLQSFMARLRGKEDPNTRIGQDVYTSNQRFLALDDVSFSVEKGERVGIIGHNGAGKSTLLKLLSRVTAPTKGTISYNGRIASMLEVGTGFHPELTGRENIYLNGAILGMSKAEIAEKFDDIVAFAEMEKFVDTPVKRYSSGMYVKLAFAVAAHLDSDILVMDEVLAVGDMKFQQKCLGKMDDVSKSEGKTVLYVSHNMNTIRQLCTRCIVLDHGKVIFDGDTEEAIGVYMDQDSEMKLSYDFTNKKRPANESKQVEITGLDVLNRKTCSIPRGEMLDILLHCRANEDTENVKIRFEFMYQDRSNVGVALSNKAVSTKKGMTYDMTIRMSTEHLAPGRYMAKALTYISNEFGNQIHLDRIDPAIVFEVYCVEKESIDWEHPYWGHVQFDDLDITHIEN